MSLESRVASALATIGVDVKALRTGLATARAAIPHDTPPPGWYLPANGVLSLGAVAPSLNVAKFLRYDIGPDPLTFDYVSLWQSGAMTLGSGANVLLKWGVWDTLADLSLPDFTKPVTTGQITPDTSTGERQLTLPGSMTRSGSVWVGTLYTYSTAPGTAPTYLAIGNSRMLPLPGLTATATVNRSASRQGLTAFPTTNPSPASGWFIDNNNSGPHPWLHRAAA